VGDPIAHSLSPVLHRAAYAVLGLDWTYDAHRVPAGELAGFVAGLGESWRGLSLTMPLKREVLDVATGASRQALLAGGANTLVRDAHGWWADNTDVPGAAAALRERAAGPDGRVDVTRAVIVGGGATATSAGLALADLGCRHVELLVRSPDRAEETRRSLAAHPGAPEVVVGPIAGLDAVRADVVVSTVPTSAQVPDLLRRVAQVPVVFEVVYDPWPSPLAAAALGDGRTLVSGLDLLVHQAALQCEAFTGVTAPLEAMRAAGEAALAERSQA
jgi:shikimate dehydrogenase